MWQKMITFVLQFINYTKNRIKLKIGAFLLINYILLRCKDKH